MADKRRLSPSEGYAAQEMDPSYQLQRIPNASPDDVNNYLQLASSSSPATANGPDAYTQALDAVTPETLLRSVSDPVINFLSSALEAGMRAAQNAVQNINDISQYYPMPQNPVTQQLLLDQSVAAGTMAKTVDNRSEYLGDLAALMNDAVTPKGSAWTMKERGDINIPSDVTLIGTPDASTQSKTTGTPNVSRTASPSATPTKQELSPRAQHMLESFQGAFPDKKFIVTESGGEINIKDVQEKTTIPISTLPSSASANAAGGRGLAELQTALVKETNSTKQLSMAYDLLAAVSAQTAAKYPQYVNLANQEQGIPDLIQQVATNRQLDALKGFPMTMQTDAAIRELSRARTVAAQRVSVLMKEDPVLGAAETLAKATIAKIKDTAGLEQKDAVAEMMAEKQQEKRAQLAFIRSDTEGLDRIALMRTGKPMVKGTEEDWTLQVYNKSIQLDKMETAMKGMPKEEMLKAYLTLDQKDEVNKVKLKNIMIHEEAKAHRGIVPEGQEGKIAYDHFKLWVSKTDVPLSTQSGTPAKVLSDYNINLTKARTSGLTGAGLSQAEHQIAATAKLEWLMQTLKDKEDADVRPWRGALQADPTSKAVLAQIAEAAPGKALPLKQFITGYMGYNDGANKADKAAALRRLVASAWEAQPQSIFFPKSSVESVLQEVDKQIVGGFMQQMLGYMSQPMVQGFVPGMPGLVTGAGAVVKSLTSTGGE